MRTTIDLPAALVAAAKAKAAAATPRPLPAYGDPGGGVLVDLLDRDVLWEAPDAG